MANINPISTSIRMTLDLGTVDGKKIEKGVSIGNLGNNATVAVLHTSAAALAALLQYPVTANKKYSTGLLVE